LPHRAANLSGLYELHIQRDGHFVTDENATGFKRRIPGQAEVFAVKLRRRWPLPTAYCPRDPSRAESALPRRSAPLLMVFLLSIP